MGTPLKVAARRSHRQVLQGNLARARRLIETLDNTLEQLWDHAGAEPGKILNGYQLPGKMEEFIREVGKYQGSPALHEALTLEELHQFFHGHGMDLLGAPLSWDEQKT